MTLDDYLERSNIDPEQYRVDMEIQATISVTNDLALEALARDKDMVPDDVKLEEEFEKAAEDSEESAKQLREGWEKQGMLTMLRDDLSRRDAMTWLRENADVTISEEELINL
jgi:trigger factor